MIWLLTIELKEMHLNRRRTTWWRQTVITKGDPVEYLQERHGKRYQDGPNDTVVEAVLLYAVQVEATPERLELLNGESDHVVGEITRTEIWPDMWPMKDGAP